jgi:hypothetical protein
VCEALVLKGTLPLGSRVRLARRRVAVVVGAGSLRERLLPDTTQLGPVALFMNRPERTLGRLLDLTGSTIVYSSVLEPRAVHGFDLGRSTVASASRSRACSAATRSSTWQCL